MVVVIGGVLSRAEVAAIADSAAEVPFEDGRATAGRFAQKVKLNEQAAESPARAAILAKVRAALEGNTLFHSIVRPRKFVRLLLSRYRPGMAYGTHVDDAIMAGARTDLSFTVFLSEPSDYEGGGLIIEDMAEARLFRPDAGDVVLYPTSALHRVESVIRGERLAVVGWVQSWVADPARREVLHDLDVVTEALDAAAGQEDALISRLLKAKTNLYRMWSDG
ncbi:PKHD-type hydroxylase [Rhodobacteraceae bacterium MBR-64]|jgi:PKHD-type hydroxylase